MAYYDYLCITKQGEWLNGQAEAADSSKLDSLLFENGLVLLTWKEVPPERNSLQTILKPIPAEEGRARWSTALPTHRLIPSIEELAAHLPPLPQFGIVPWLQAHTGGAVTNGRHAFLVLSVCGGFLISAIYLAQNGLKTSFSEKPALSLPAVNQPDLSNRKFNDQFRRTKIYHLDKARATMIKPALDHVLRRTSMTSQISTSLDNALVIKATALDLDMIDTLIPLIDKEYGQATDAQISSSIVEVAAMAQAKWKRVKHETPSLTPDEERDLEIEKNAQAYAQ